MHWQCNLFAEKIVLSSKRFFYELLMTIFFAANPNVDNEANILGSGNVLLQFAFESYQLQHPTVKLFPIIVISVRFGAV